MLLLSDLSYRFVTLKNGNVIVDFITAKLSKNKINFLDALSSLIFGLTALFFSFRMVLGARDMFVYQEETMLLAFPIWIPFLPVIAIFLSFNYLLFLYFYLRFLYCGNKFRYGSLYPWYISISNIIFYVSF